MLKTIAAAALSATVALTSLAPTPAQAADQEDIAKLLFGVGIAALLAKAINDANKDRDSDREVHIHRHVTRPYQQPVQRPRVIVPQPKYKHVTKPPKVKEIYRTVPSSCQRVFRHDGANRVFFTRACLERSGVRTANLPNQCERILDLPGNRTDRLVWNRACLQNQGYRIR